MICNRATMRALTAVALTAALPCCTAIAAPHGEDDSAYRALVESYERAQTRYEDLLSKEFDRLAPSPDPYLPSLLRALIDSNERGERRYAELLKKESVVPVAAIYQLLIDANERAEKGYAGALDKYSQLIDRLISMEERTPTPDGLPRQVNVTLDQASIDQLVGAFLRLRSMEHPEERHQRDGDVPPIPEKTPVASQPKTDLWNSDAFQTLMSTLWQAPLVILGLVLAVGGFFGWQGFKDVKQSLEQQLTGKFEKVTEWRFASSVGTTLLQVAAKYWQLSEDLEDHEGGRVDPNGVPPLLSPHGCAHVAMAKGLLEGAWARIEALPPGYKIDDKATRESALISIRQSWAYHVATLAALRPGSISGSDWLEALSASDAARRAMRQGPSGKAALWLDTYLYVRILYSRAMLWGNTNPAAANKAFSRARRAFLQFEHETTQEYKEVINRFRPLI